MRARILAVSTLIATALSLSLPAVAQDATGDVTVVHGFRGLTADVYLDGQLVLEGFTPERITDPMALPAGAHDVRVYEAGAATTETPVVAGSLDVTAGANISAVVHAAQDGTPRLSAFVNDTSQIPAGSVRLAVRHTAASGPIDVLLDGAPLVTGIANGSESTEQVPAAAHQVAVAAAGAADPLIPPQDAEFPEGTVMSLYLVGSATDNSLSWLAQTIAGSAGAPSAVSTGNSGLAAPRQTAVPVALVAASFGVFLVVAGRRRRAREHG